MRCLSNFSFFFFFLKKLHMCSVAYNLWEVSYCLSLSSVGLRGVCCQGARGCSAQLPEVNDSRAAICAEFCLRTQHAHISRGKGSLQALQWTSAPQKTFQVEGPASWILKVQVSHENLASGESVGQASQPASVTSWTLIGDLASYKGLTKQPAPTTSCFYMQIQFSS